MTGALLFNINLLLFVVHEFDAVRCREWRMFLGFKNLSDDSAGRIFSILHIPLFSMVGWLLTQPDDHLRYWFMVSFDAFWVLHLGLHIAFVRHPENRFTSWFSKTVIALLALGGGLHGALLILSPQTVL